MDLICLKSRTGRMMVDRELLQKTSKVFQNLQKRDPQFKLWQLDDFSHRCLEQFAEFATEFGDVDIKIPERALESDQLCDYIQNSGVVAFIQKKASHELFELMFLANFIECSTLFQLCYLQIACWMVIPSHAAMATHFGLPLEIPSDQLMCQISKRRRSGSSVVPEICNGTE
jgi:hypothetical protein